MGSAIVLDDQPSLIAKLDGQLGHNRPEPMDLGPLIPGNSSVDVLPSNSKGLENIYRANPGSNPQRSTIGLSDQTLGHAGTSLPLPRNRRRLPVTRQLWYRIQFCIVSCQQSFRPGLDFGIVVL